MRTVIATLALTGSLGLLLTPATAHAAAPEGIGPRVHCC